MEEAEVGVSQLLHLPNRNRGHILKLIIHSKIEGESNAWRYSLPKVVSRMQWNDAAICSIRTVSMYPQRFWWCI
jgi:hypothetical protein